MSDAVVAGKGRALVATTGWDTGAVLYTEAPFLSIPSPTSLSDVCIHCLGLLSTAPAPAPCDNCSRMLYCSGSCAALASSRYHGLECEGLALWGSPDDPAGASPLLYKATRHSRHILLAARYLSTMLSSLRRADQDDVDLLSRQMAALMGRGVSFADDPALIAAHKGLAATVLTEGDNAELFDVAWLDSLLGKFQLNSFKIEVREPSEPGGWLDLGVGLYEQASKHNHSCEPNVEIVFGAVPRSPARLQAVALKPIAPGDELTISYCDPDEPAAHRANYLATAYGFDCQCPRCIAAAPQA